MKNNIAIIPARSGSLRIKGKNIKLFYGKPVISYSIKTALRSKIFKKIVVSTDDIKIANISRKYGASVDFLRPKKLANNKTGMLKVIKHSLLFYKKKKIKFENICCIFPVAPLLKVSLLKKSLRYLKFKGVDFVFPVIKSNKKNSKFFSLDNKKRIKRIYKKFNKKYFSDAGQFYWGKLKTWEKNKKIFSNNSMVLICNQNDLIDVNDLRDWKNLVRRYKKL